MPRLGLGAGQRRGGARAGRVRSVQLTGSAGLITPATRALMIDGDARIGETSYGIHPAKTNLLANSSFETDLYGWHATSGADTPERVNDNPLFGDWCCLVHDGIEAVDCALLTASRDGAAGSFIRADAECTIHIALLVADTPIAEGDYTVGTDWTELPAILFYEFGGSNAQVTLRITRTGGGDFWIDNPALYQNGNTDLNVPKLTGGVWSPPIETDYNRSFWIGQPNLVPNGNFASGITGWTAFGTGAAVAWDEPNKRCQVTVNSASGIGVRYEAQFTVPINVDGALDLKLTAPVGTAFTIEAKHSGTRVAIDFNFVMSTAQRRIILPFTTTGSGSTNLSIYISRNGTAPLVFYVEPGVTVKQSDGMPIAVPTGRRDWGVLTWENAGNVLRADQMWIAMCVRPMFGTDHYPGGSPRWWRWRDAGAPNPDANRIEAFYAVSTDVWGVRRGYPEDHFFGANISADDIPCVLGQEYILIGQYTPDYTAISVNGSLFDDFPGSSKKVGGSIPTIDTDTLEIGGTGFAEASPSGGKDILWMMIGHGILTDDDIGTLNVVGSTDPAFDTLPVSARTKFRWTAETAIAQRK